MSYLPDIDKKLVAALAEKFPDKSPSLDFSDKEVWFRAGQASVVRYLAAQQEAQEQDPLRLEVI
tara:strand:+ start:995 stop:1186 length:192 start_codon:yes stop_codon:yes gene_type:complete